MLRAAVRRSRSEAQRRDGSARGRGGLVPVVAAVFRRPALRRRDGSIPQSHARPRRANSYNHANPWGGGEGPAATVTESARGGDIPYPIVSPFEIEVMLA